jgi:hypothetical protein
MFPKTTDRKEAVHRRFAAACDALARAEEVCRSAKTPASLAERDAARREMSAAREARNSLRKTAREHER